ncbi:hypothetical protein CDD83_6840 [Cordyceps sp. RAO-2017]|nr:hypothetical protein CDD83_6840 [Cordyceps sp. RAO-2017]
MDADLDDIICDREGGGESLPDKAVDRLTGMENNYLLTPVITPRSPAIEMAEWDPDDLITVASQPASSRSQSLRIDFRYSPDGELLIDNEPVRSETVAEGHIKATEPVMESLDDDSLCSLDDDSLCVSDIVSHIPAKIRAEFLACFLYNFYKRKGAQDDQPSQSSGSPLTATPRHQRSSPGYSQSVTSRDKRKQGQGDDDEDDEDDDDDVRGRRPKKPRPSADDVLARRLACPYRKWKPLAYRECGSKTLRTMSRVKQHLRRFHRRPLHCPLCYDSVSSTGDLEDHLRARSCPVREKKTVEGITEDQEKELSKRVNTSKSLEAQWNDVFAIVFPGEPLPSSPYLEGLPSRELGELQDFLVQEWPPIYSELAERLLPEELREHQDLVRDFSYFVFEQANGIILERFEARRPRHGPDSAYKSGSDGTGSSGPAGDDAAAEQDPPGAGDDPLAGPTPSYDLTPLLAETSGPEFAVGPDHINFHSFDTFPY